MAEEKVNTTESIKNGKQVTAASLDAEMKNAAKILGSDKVKKVAVTVPKYLEKRLGKTVPIVINGARITVPVGKKVSIPEPYAEVLNASLNELKL